LIVSFFLLAACGGAPAPAATEPTPASADECQTADDCVVVQACCPSDVHVAPRSSASSEPFDPAQCAAVSCLAVDVPLITSAACERDAPDQALHCVPVRAR
jgi:hypothetical protein